MDRSQIVTIFDSLDRQRRIYFLARVAGALTLAMRAMYSEAPQAVTTVYPTRIAELNEAQHVVLGYLIDELLAHLPAIRGTDVVALLWGDYARTDSRGHMLRALIAVAREVGAHLDSNGD